MSRRTAAWAIRDAMAQDTIALIEELTEREVMALLSAIDRELAGEMFVLAPATD